MVDSTHGWHIGGEVNLPRPERVNCGGPDVCVDCGQEEDRQTRYERAVFGEGALQHSEVKPPDRNIFEHSEGFKIMDVTKYDDQTLVKVRDVLTRKMHLTSVTADNIIVELLNAGILFRERG